MISMYTKQEIIILSYREGKSHRQISRELQINRKTIKKYIDDFERHQSGSTQPETALSTYLSSPPLFRIGTRSKVHLTQEVQSFIDAQLEANGKKVQQGMRKQILKNIDILQLLHEQGFGIGYTTVCNYIREKLGKSATRQEAFIRQQYEPGSVCEFDWGEIKLNIAGHIFRFQQAEQYLETIISKINQGKQQLTGRTAMEMFADEKDLLWQHTGPLACSDSEQLRVDKYATISHLTNRYSVSEKLVGCFVDVKIFSNTIEAYFENKPVASHQRDYGKHQWVIDIEHYLDTLRQKPGALNGSVALTCRPYLKQLYQQYYTDAPRDFIDLLHYCHEHKISEENLEATVSRLVDLCPQSITTEKLTALLGNKPKEDVKPVAVNNQTAYLAKEQLKQITALMN